MIETAGSTRSRGRLLRVLGLAFGIAVTVGNTIGAGLLRTAGDVAARLPDARWFLGVWLLGGVLAILAAFSLAELATRIPRSGGHFVFIRAALGDYPGFVIGWTDWLSNVTTTSSVAIVAGEYIGRLYPPMLPYATASAVGITIFFGVLHWLGVKVGAEFQNITTAIKALGFFALIGACFVFAPADGAAASSAVAASMPTGSALLLALVLATQAIVFTYDGFAGIIYFGDETTDPQRTIPRSIFAGTAVIIAIYMLTNAAIVRVLPMATIANNNLALGEAARTLWGARALSIIELLIVVSLLAALNAYPMISSRILYTLGHDGLFWRAVDRVNAKGTPDIALGICTVMSVLFILSGTFEQVLAITAFFFACNYAGDLIALLVLRRREGATAGFRTPGYPWTTIVALVVYVAFLVGAVWGDRRNSGFSLLLIVLTYPLYRLARRSHTI